MHQTVIDPPGAVRRARAAFSRLADELESAADAAVFLRSVIDTCVGLTGTEAGCIALADEDGRLHVVATSGPAASAARSVHTVPMRVLDDVVGTLALFNEEPGALAPDDAAALQMLVDVATPGVLQERLIRTCAWMPDGVRRLVEARSVLERAGRVLMTSRALPAREALQAMRELHERSGTTLQEVALGVLEGHVRVPLTS